METKRLNDVISESEIDFLQIDVQSAALDVLCSAERLLPTAMAVEVEMEFVSQYEGYPLFLDIDNHMRGQGFQPHALSGLSRMFYTPVSNPAVPLSGLN